MHWTIRSTVTAGFAVASLTATTAGAQTQIVPASRPRIGVAFGGSTIFECCNAGGDKEVTVMLELPVVSGWNVRAEVGRGRFQFPVPDPDPPPRVWEIRPGVWVSSPPEGPRHTPVRDVIGLTRITIGVTGKWEPEDLPLPGFYLGGGLGLYRFGFDAHSDVQLTRLGVFGVGGLRIPEEAPFSIAAEVQTHFIRGPRTERGGADNILNASIGIRMRF